MVAILANDCHDCFYDDKNEMGNEVTEKSEGVPEISDLRERRKEGGREGERERERSSFVKQLESFHK